MTFSRFVEVGRVAAIAKGRKRGTLVVIIDVIDQNRVLVEGPTTGVSRRPIPVYKLRLTDYKIKIAHDARSKTVREAFKKSNVMEEWEQTVWYKKMQNQKKRAEMTDFDRYKLMRAKQARSKILRAEVNKLRTAQKAKAKAAK
ncbi:large ribosomal subunit protein eL14-like [Amphiura filiformis]|uniref:large ribosomal subunit protein eL14-like n=1 Tax=Amphiura filiformis TaxID=82378 RepID=UPI003B2221FF